MIYGKQKIENGKPQKEVKKYVCDFCKHEFEQYVRRLDVGNNGTNKYISSQVKCPKCKNFIKTWK